MVFIEKKLNISNIHVFLTYLLVALIPFAVVLPSWVLFLWFLSAIILMIRHKVYISNVKFNFWLLISILMYLAFVAGVFYSKNIPSAIFDVQMKMALLIIPPVLYLLGSFHKKHFNIVLLIFVSANILAGLLCVGFAFYYSVSFHDGAMVFNSSIPGVYEDTNTEVPGYFSYSDFSIFKHPSYFSMYIVLSFFIIIYFLRNSCFILKNHKRNKLLYYVAMTFFVMLVYFLKSKTAYLTLILFSVIYIIAFAVKNKQYIIGAIIILALVIISIFGFKQNSRFFYVKMMLSNQNEICDAIKRKDYNAVIDTYGADRIVIWMMSAEIISEHFWTGVGSGDVFDNLKSKYKAYKIHSLETSKLNSHNQYLETFIAVGVFGFLIFMIWLIYPVFLKENYNRKRFLILIFSGIIIINFLFEAVLNTFSGVIFVAFFYSYLFFVPDKAFHAESN